MIEQAVGVLRRRILGSLTYSMQGLKACFENEEAFRVEVLFAVFLVPLGFWLGDTPIEQLLLVGSVLLVLIVELLNSAVEAVVDRIGTEFSELSGRAKDQGSAAVLLSLAMLALTWVLIVLK